MAGQSPARRWCRSRRLTEATEHVAATHDLGERIEERGDDELGRLASSFNAMLEALDESVGAQRRLVADASHELRTPLTSLRTNIEVLERARDMPEGERRRLLDDMLDQQAELATLVTDLIDLARGDEPEGAIEDVRIDELARGAIDRAERARSRVEFESELSPCVVRGDRARLDRALSNLLDNAAKWTDPGTSVVVTVGDGRADRARPRTGLSAGRPRRTSSIASTGRPTLVACPVRASAWRSCARWSRPREGVSAPRTPAAEAR